MADTGSDEKIGLGVVRGDLSRHHARCSKGPDASHQWRVFVSTEPSKATAVLPGKVEKVIHPHPASGEPEKAQIAVEGADHLYREIRVPNTLTDAEGHEVKLKEGAEVDVKIEAEQAVTTTSAAPDLSTQPRRRR